MQQHDQPSEPFGLDQARAFIARAIWTWAESYAAFAPHEYCVRQRCRGFQDEFTAFARLIEDAGYWRIWGRNRWRSLLVDERIYWLYKDPIPPEERTVINRWWRDRMAPEPAQLSLEVE